MAPAVRTDTGGDRVAAGRAGALINTLAAWGEFRGGIAASTGPPLAMGEQVGSTADQMEPPSE